jgi:hypothetical protein
VGHIAAINPVYQPSKKEGQLIGKWDALGIATLQFRATKHIEAGFACR